MTALHAQIIEEIHLSLSELCRASGSSEAEVIAWVAEGVLEAKGSQPGSQPQQWHFSGASLHRARHAQHLAHHLEINAAGIAFALDLLDEIRQLRTQLEHSSRR